EGRHRTTRPTRIATCPVGYNDGYPYQLLGRGEAMVRGRRVPVVGNVTMDYIMLDLGEVPNAEVGDEVTLIGDGIRVEELARRAEHVHQVPVDFQRAREQQRRRPLLAEVVGETAGLDGERNLALALFLALALDLAGENDVGLPAVRRLAGAFELARRFLDRR